MSAVVKTLRDEADGRKPGVSWLVFVYGVLAAAASLAPLVEWLDERGWLPLALRDRPWTVLVVALSAIALAGAVAWRQRYLVSALWRGALAVVVVGAAALALGFTLRWHRRYALPAATEWEGIGQPLRGAQLVDDSGRAFVFAALRGRPILVVWFKGAWCPYCRKQLANLQRALPEYRQDVHVVAVTSDPPELLQSMRAELGLEFAVVSDAHGQFMAQCELMHCVAVADRDGIVTWGVVSGNWRGDVPERALLQAAYAE
jgi:peroxiredoxin